MTRLITMCAVALALLFSNPVYANWYGSIQAGANWLDDADTTISAGPAALSGDVEFDSGYTLSGAIGYAYPSGLRLEGELSYRNNDLDQVEGIGLDGDVGATAVLANLWYDFKTGGKWKPYIGGGLGFAQVGLELDGFDDNDWVFAYQLGAGVAFPVASKTDLTIDYRYFATSDPEFKDLGVKIDSEIRSHALMLGLRFGF